MHRAIGRAFSPSAFYRTFFYSRRRQSRGWSTVLGTRQFVGPATEVAFLRASGKLSTSPRRFSTRLNRDETAACTPRAAWPLGGQFQLHRGRSPTARFTRIKPVSEGRTDSRHTSFSNVSFRKPLRNGAAIKMKESITPNRSVPSPTFFRPRILPLSPFYHYRITEKGKSLSRDFRQSFR